MRQENVLFDITTAIKECSTDGESVSKPFLHFSIGDDVTEVWKWITNKLPCCKDVSGLLAGDIQVYQVLSGSLKTALEHIEQRFDCKANVFFEDNLWWDYSNQTTGESFDFEGMEIDQGIMEDAGDTVKETEAYYFL